MRVVKELDAGPMLATVTVPIGPDDTSLQVERTLSERGAPLLLDVVEQLARGNAIETPQDDAAATYAPKILKTESPIDWSLPAIRIHDLVRGLQPWPLASTTYAGHRLLIHRTEAMASATGAPAGTVVEAQGDTLSVAAGDGKALRLLEIQPEGKRTMSAREFLSGHKVAPGTRLPS
jgi:methionyl-tRNA formyltransferase